MEQSRLKKYGVYVDVWLGVSLLAIAVCVYFFIIISVEMADFCGNGKIEDSGFLNPIYEYAECVIHWPSFFKEFTLSMQFWFCILIFPALFTRNFLRRKPGILQRKLYYVGLLLISVMGGYALGYYGFLDVPALNKTWVESVVKMIVVTLLIMIPLHYFLECACFVQRRWLRLG